MEDVKVNLDEKRIAEILKYAEWYFLPDGLLKR